MNEIKIQHL